MTTQANSQKKTNNPFDIFVIGARKGFTLATQSLMPNVIRAYVLAEILRILGVFDWLGLHAGGVMGLFALPGEALTVLLATWLSCSAGVGVAAALMAAGTLTPEHITILAPAFILMASQIQYMGRLLGVTDTPKKYWPMLMAISIFNACIGMLIIRLFV